MSLQGELKPKCFSTKNFCSASSTIWVHLFLCTGILSWIGTAEGLTKLISKQKVLLGISIHPSLLSMHICEFLALLSSNALAGIGLVMWVFGGWVRQALSRVAPTLNSHWAAKLETQLCWNASLSFKAYFSDPVLWLAVSPPQIPIMCGTPRLSGSLWPEVIMLISPASSRPLSTDPEWRW